MNLDDWVELLACPSCGGDLRRSEDESLACRQCGETFPSSFDRQVLVSERNELFGFLRSDPSAPTKTAARRVPSYLEASVNLAQKRVLAVAALELRRRPSARVLVLGARGQRSTLDPMFGDMKMEILYSDVDPNGDVDLFCDAHQIPFRTATFDLVITTAVLEHVVDAPRVAKEIERVTAVGGLVYSELPFLQRVHEGPYDFARYTMSGHRGLFRGFEVHEMGLVSGPGTALLWAIEGLVVAPFTNRRAQLAAKLFVRTLFGWVKYLDFALSNRPGAVDGAAGTFLLGRRSTFQATDADLVAGYRGSQ